MKKALNYIKYDNRISNQPPCQRLPKWGHRCRWGRRNSPWKLNLHGSLNTTCNWKKDREALAKHDIAKFQIFVLS